jgi:hypothetical protein
MNTHAATSVPDSENPPVGLDEIDSPSFQAEIDGTKVNVVWLGEDGELAFVVGHTIDEAMFRLALSRSIGEVDDFYADGDVERGWIVARLHMPDCREGTGRDSDVPDETCTCGEEWAWWGQRAKADDEGAIAVTWWTA